MTFFFPEEKDDLFEDFAPDLEFETEEEVFTGVVQGKDATDLEERVARAHEFNNIGYRFKVIVPTLFSFPGQSKELDFLSYPGTLAQPLGVKGYIGHNTQAQKLADVERELILNVTFRKLGWLDFKALEWTQLGSQDEANRAVRELLR